MLVSSRWRQLFYHAILFSEVFAAVSPGAVSNGSTVSPTLNEQFCRTWYHVSGLQQIWDKKGVQNNPVWSTTY